MNLLKLQFFTHVDHDALTLVDKLCGSLRLFRDTMQVT
jgi:predicted membrane GTPase involved in stress response